MPCFEGEACSCDASGARSASPRHRPLVFVVVVVPFVQAATEHLCVSVYHTIVDLSFIYIAYKVVDRNIIFYSKIYTLYIICR